MSVTPRVSPIVHISMAVRLDGGPVINAIRTADDQWMVELDDGSYLLLSVQTPTVLVQHMTRVGS